ncbi:MAG: type II toxin-antitoxin system VapC family toxin [Planctomycetota bacterium]
MDESVYIETSIFSFYHDRRKGAAIVAMRGWTRQWWDEHRQNYDVVTSTAVLAELDKGNLQHREEALAMAMRLPAIAVEDEIRDIVDFYIQHRVMPNDPVGDAMHLALASFHKFDYLLTWNCVHLANANKFGHIRRVNALLGLHVPALVTPQQLIGGK